MLGQGRFESLLPVPGGTESQVTELKALIVGELGVPHRQDFRIGPENFRSMLRMLAIYRPHWSMYVHQIGNIS